MTDYQTITGLKFMERVVEGYCGKQVGILEGVWEIDLEQPVMYQELGFISRTMGRVIG
jgi:hypothetical protein